MMKIRFYKNLVLIVIPSLIIISGAQAESQLDELRKEFGSTSPEKAKVMADDCKNAADSMAQGLILLREKSRNLLEANKKYHDSEGLLETARKTRDKGKENYDKLDRQWSGWWRKCQEEFELARGYREGGFELDVRNWKHPLFESYSKWKNRMREEELLAMMKVPECRKADDLYYNLVPAIRKLADAENDYPIMKREFEEKEKAYKDTFSDYHNIFLLNIMNPYVKHAEKCGQDENKEWAKLGLRIPKWDDLISERSLIMFLGNIEDAKAKMRDRCTRLGAWAQLGPQGEKEETEKGRAVEQAMKACDFDKAARLLQQMPAGKFKSFLDSELKKDKVREEKVRIMWDKAEDDYKEAQGEARKGNVQKARSAYEETIEELNKAWATTICEYRKRKIDESTKKVRGRLAALKDSPKQATQKATTKELLSDAEVKAFADWLWNKYAKRWSDEWCIYREKRKGPKGYVNRSGCASEPHRVIDELIASARGARTREKQSIIRKRAAELDGCMMKETTDQVRRTCIENCYKNNLMPK
jgi:hypothetical protein